MLHQDWLCNAVHHPTIREARKGPCLLRGQPTILKLQFLYFIGMETIHHTERLCASDFLGPGPARAQGQIYRSKEERPPSHHCMYVVCGVREPTRPRCGLGGFDVEWSNFGGL